MTLIEITALVGLFCRLNELIYQYPAKIISKYHVKIIVPCQIKTQKCPRWLTRKVNCPIDGSHKEMELLALVALEDRPSSGNSLASTSVVGWPSRGQVIELTYANIWVSKLSK